MDVRQAENPGGPGPLAGVRVLDLTRLLPGGFATAMLADLGAEVIKVEQPGLGEYELWTTNRLGHVSGQSWVMDRNKRSVALDLKDDRGRDAFKALARTADVVIEGFRPGVVARLGVSYGDLRPENPALVYCSITGYGQNGPAALEPGHDINYIGRAGLLSITGTPERPVLPGVQVGDVGGGGLTALVGLLAALICARETGEGDHVDVAMTDGAFAWLCTQMGVHFATGAVPRRGAGILTGGYPCYNVYECADGEWLTVGALEAKFFRVLCEVVDREDLFETRMDAEAIPTWRELFKQRSREDWLARFEGRDACVGPVNDFPAAVADVQLRHRGMIDEQDDPDGDPHPQLGTPIKLRNRPASWRSPAPVPGQDTRHYLEQAGLSSAEIDEMVASGAAG